MEAKGKLILRKVSYLSEDAGNAKRLEAELDLRS